MLHGELHCAHFSRHLHSTTHTTLALQQHAGHLVNRCTLTLLYLLLPYPKLPSHPLPTLAAPQVVRWSDATYLEDQDMWRLRWGGLWLGLSPFGGECCCGGRGTGCPCGEGAWGVQGRGQGGYQE